MKTQTRLLTILLFAAISFMTLQFVACGKDDAEPAPNTPPEKEEPAKKPEQPKEEEEEEELCDTNNNITSVTFPIQRNAALSETITMQPDENNIFTERVFDIIDISPLTNKALNGSHISFHSSIVQTGATIETRNKR